MTKSQALYKFYNSFLPAYEENSVPVEAKFPYITYELSTSQFEDSTLSLSAQIWYKADSLTAINTKTEEMSRALREDYKIKVDDGYIVLHRGSPFGTSVSTEDKTVKCKAINIEADFITL